MKIHKEGYQIIFGAFILTASIISLSAWFLGGIPVLNYSIIAAIILFFIFIVRFFRYPQRPISFGADNIVCPADGKVVAIEEVDEKEYFKDRRIQVSVFMSPNNVHVNFFPIAGIVAYSKYHK